MTHKWTALLISLLLLINAYGLTFAQPSAKEKPEELLLLDSRTVYSFRGLDGHGFLRRQPVNIPEPVYPGQKTGLVVLLATIHPSGQVSRVKLEPNQEGLATVDMIRASKAAILQWKFNPLSNNRLQSEEQVRVLIQFNHANSGLVYSEDGNTVIEGLASRRPVRLLSPGHSAYEGGVVTAELTLDQQGNVAWVDRYYGSQPSEKVNPHLGLRVHEVLSKWQFVPQTNEQAEGFQQIKAVFRFHGQAKSSAVNASLSPSLPE